MVELTAKERLRRAAKSKTRVAAEQLELVPGDLVDFWRDPATKGESGWHGPATVVEIGPPHVLRWQQRMIQVRTQDVRRALVCAVFLTLHSGTEPQGDAPVRLLMSFADSLQSRVVRLGWVASQGWQRARANRDHTEVLIAALHTAACSLHLDGCVSCRIGQGVPSLEGVIECDASFLWWWTTGRPGLTWYHESPGSTRMVLTDIFGRDQWRNTSFVQFLLAAEVDVDYIKQYEPDIPHIGGPFTPSFKPPIRYTPYPPGTDRPAWDSTGGGPPEGAVPDAGSPDRKRPLPHQELRKAQADNKGIKKIRGLPEESGSNSGGGPPEGVGSKRQATGHGTVGGGPPEGSAAASSSASNVPSPGPILPIAEDLPGVPDSDDDHDSEATQEYLVSLLTAPGSKLEEGKIESAVDEHVVRDLYGPPDPEGRAADGLHRGPVSDPPELVVAGYLKHLLCEPGEQEVEPLFPGDNIAEVIEDRLHEFMDHIVRYRRQSLRTKPRPQVVDPRRCCVAASRRRD